MNLNGPHLLAISVRIGYVTISYYKCSYYSHKKYFEFNPVIGYIQKESSLDIWVKFTADKDIVIYLNKFMEDKNNYRIPFQMTVKEQLLPV